MSWRVREGSRRGRGAGQVRCKGTQCYSNDWSPGARRRTVRWGRPCFALASLTTHPSTHPPTLSTRSSSQVRASGASHLDQLVQVSPAAALKPGQRGPHKVAHNLVPRPRHVELCTYSGGGGGHPWRCSASVCSWADSPFVAAPPVCQGFRQQREPSRCATRCGGNPGLSPCQIWLSSDTRLNTVPFFSHGRYLASFLVQPRRCSRRAGGRGRWHGWTAGSGGTGAGRVDSSG